MVEPHREIAIHYAKSSREIAGNIFILSQDSEADRIKKQSGGFCVFEEKSWDTNQIPRQLKSGVESVSVWLKSPRNFHSLIQLVAIDNPILKDCFTEEELRLTLHEGAQEEILALKTSFEDTQTHNDSKRWIFGLSLPISMTQERILGLEKFQENLLAKKA
jgi:hypothetical protein